MSTPNLHTNDPERTDADGLPVCTNDQPCPDCLACHDSYEVFTYTRDLGFLALLVWMLHVATQDISGGWTAWSLAIAAVLALCAIDSLSRLMRPLARTTVRLVRRVVPRA